MRAYPKETWTNRLNPRCPRGHAVRLLSAGFHKLCQQRNNKSQQLGIQFPSCDHDSFRMEKADLGFLSLCHF